jgi:hypothetical protein
MSLHSLNLGFGEGTTCPKVIKLFQNVPNLGFECADHKAIQSINVEEGETGAVVELQKAKWSRCDNISIFVETNHGDEVTRLTSCRLYFS